jgi:hypothetical protein
MKRILLISFIFGIGNYLNASIILGNKGYTYQSIPGVCNSDYVQIYWTTDLEINTDWFQVLRTTDANAVSHPDQVSGTGIGSRINACGTCSGHSYSQNDVGPFIPGTVYYYIIQVLSSNIITGPTYTYYYICTFTDPVPVSVDWKAQVTDYVDISSTPSTPSSYVWGQESNIIEGAGVNVLPTEIRAIYFEQNNCIVDFTTRLSDVSNTAPFFMASLQVNYDNQGYSTIYNGGPIADVVWNSPNTFSSLGQHDLKIIWLDAVSGNYFDREYTVYVCETSQQFFKDNFCNDMRLWEGPGDPTTQIPLLLSEGFDANNIRSEEFYRYAGQNLIDCAIQKGFKVYVLNYAYNSQDIVNSAAIYSSAISYISSINNNAQVVAAGMSMGGVVVRYALADAENSGTPLPVSKFVSIDSPQQYAVISADLQNFLNSSHCAIAPPPYSTNALNNMAAEELLKYNTFDPGGSIHQNFYSTLNSLNGNGYPHLTTNIAVSFSNGLPNPNSGTWESIKFTGLFDIYPVCGQVDNIALSADELVAGSYLPLISTATDEKDILWGFLTENRITNPTFIPYISSWDIVNGNSKFDITIKSGSNSYHDVVPNDIVTPLINAMLIDNLFLQNKTITDTRNYIASQTITAGSNVTSSVPVGDFVVDNGAVVNFTAGQSINLQPGFEAKAGSFFHASIVPPPAFVAQCDGSNAQQGMRTTGNSGIVNSGGTRAPSLTNNQIQASTNGIPTSIKDSLSQSFNQVRVYPNPNNGRITVELNLQGQNLQTIKEFKLYNLTGQLVFSQPLNNINNSLDLIGNGVSNGMYYYIITANGQKIKQEKLVVIR